MSNELYVAKKMRIGWILLALGAVLFLAGLIMQFWFTLPFNTRIVAGLGIFCAGLGLSYLLRYRGAGKDRQAITRQVNEERDERNRLIRAEAGNRAFLVSMVMTYTALMWASFASNGSLPEFSPDGLWWYLAAAFVIPFGVYTASIVIGQNKS